jgi:glycerophosphoryl diester phosphodiesterase
MTPHQILDRIYQGRTLVFGHRGASAYAPMNTLPAFELAAEQGADGIELDVHRTRDGHAVVIHDFTIDATTNGTGTVTEMTLEQLKALDAGSWFGPEFAGTPMPTLDEVFEAVGRRLYVNVEIKSLSLQTDGIEQVVADAILRADLKERVIVSSFNPLALIRFRQMLPDVPLGFLHAPNVPRLPSEMIAELTYELDHPFHEMIDSDYVAQMRQNGIRINTWTVNDPARALELRALGVDLLITDKPDVIREALGR